MKPTDTLPELALPFSFRLSAPHAIAGVEGDPNDRLTARSNRPDYAAATLAIESLFRTAGYPPLPPSGLMWGRDPLGRPIVNFAGELATWARENSIDAQSLHVSNTHDGGAHLVAAAYGPELAGLGIDLVWLPRLRGPRKDRAYLLRFASQFMSAEEHLQFCCADVQWPGIEACLRPPAFDPGGGSPRSDAAAAGQGPYRSGMRERVAEPALGEQAHEGGCDAADPAGPLRLRAAAHFSLMEAASKACGTGLKIGVGMGRPTSLPKQSLGVRSLTPDVELMFGPPALARLRDLGAVRYEASVQAAGAMLVSLVALYRGGCGNLQKEAGGIERQT